MRFELRALAAIIVLLNLPLLHGACAVDMIFLPGRVAAGEWWRIFTHAFVHVSWYHLLLDGTAFLILYQGLVGRSGFERMGYVLACGTGSLLASLWSAPIIQTHGLCGLSGIAHGLMAISALDRMNGRTDKTLQRAGAATFIIVVAKSIIEAATGRIVFESLHFGALGSPVAVCHAGGVLGGLVVMVIQFAGGGVNSSMTCSSGSRRKTCQAPSGRRLRGRCSAPRASRCRSHASRSSTCRAK